MQIDPDAIIQNMRQLSLAEIRKRLMRLKALADNKERRSHIQATCDLTAIAKLFEPDRKG